MDKKYAIILMVIAAFLQSLYPVFLKKYKVSFIYQIIISTLAVLIPSTAVVSYYNTSMSNKFQFKDLFLNKNRLCYGFLLTVFYYLGTYGFKILPLSVSLPIFMLFPITILIGNRLINKIEFSMAQFLGAMTTFIGILIICYSKTKVKGGLPLQAILAMFFGTISLGFAYTILKVTPERTFIKEDANKMNDYEDTIPELFRVNVQMVQETMLPLLMSILLLIFLNIYNKSTLTKFMLKEPFDKSSVIAFLAATFTITYTYNMFYFESYNNLSPALYSSLENLEVIFSLIIGYVVLNEKIGMKKIIGCILIIVGVSVNVYFGEDEHHRQMGRHRSRRKPMISTGKKIKQIKQIK